MLPLDGLVEEDAMGISIAQRADELWECDAELSDQPAHEAPWRGAPETRRRPKNPQRSRLDADTL